MFLSAFPRLALMLASWLTLELHLTLGTTWAVVHFSGISSMLAYLLKLISAGWVFVAQTLNVILFSVPFLSRGKSFPNECWEGELSSQHCHPGIPLHHDNLHVKLADVITFGLFYHYWVMVLVLLLIVGIKSDGRGVSPETPGQVCEIHGLQQPPEVLSRE